MNRLDNDTRARIVAALCDGNSVRATCRIVGVAKGTVLKLLPEIGAACREYHNANVRGLAAQRIQVDEIWAFVGAKEKNVLPELKGHGMGDAWTFTAIDADTKLMIGYHVGQRNAAHATTFMRSVVARLANRVQLTTDGHGMYLVAVPAAFDWQSVGVDYAMLQKRYASAAESGRYSPAVCVGATKEWVMGKPARKHVSTSYVERANLTMRMNMRRFTRLTNAFSKKLENHAHAVALFAFHYNYCRPHMTLTKARGGIHTTPAMVAGLTSHVWTLEEVLGLLPGASHRAA